MAVLAVVTSSPLGVEGGHLVIARSLVAAAREQGHTRTLVVTPDFGFGRTFATYRANWSWDVTGVDQVISPPVSELRRRPSGARVLAQPHHARVLRLVARVCGVDLGEGAGEGERQAVPDPSRRLVAAAIPAHAGRRAVAHDPAPVARRPGRPRGCVVAAAPAARVPMRRVRRLHPRRLAADAHEAPRSVDPRAGGTRGPICPRRHRR